MGKKKNDDISEFDDWYENHQEDCSINHIGSAGKMEIDAVKEIFSRSIEKHNVKYATYIGDGDSQTFEGILELNPYGELIVQKRECVGHVEKRMGSRLRNLKKTNKDIGGKGAGKLTDKVIGELTTYYGLAIRRHPHSISEMKKAIWATYYHKSSTDENPQHMYCPSGSESWCKWRKAEANDTLNSYTHDHAPLNDNVLQLLKPIYEILSDDRLLERCLGAETQNNNESLNSLIWTISPKHIHSGRKSVEIATFLAVSIFNEGFLPILKILSVMGVTIGQQAQMYANSRDQHRIDRSERRSTDLAKKARIAHREERSAEQDYFEQEEGPLYSPGLAD